MNILVTGGCGFIGSAFIRFVLNQTTHKIINIDKLTYAANDKALSGYKKNSRYKFYQGDICNAGLIEDVLNKHRPTWIVNFAAESHVDKSIFHPSEFIDTNIMGTYQLLQGSLGYWSTLGQVKKEKFRFLHISTDEVFGELGKRGQPFTETSTFKPSSPYSASKAASDSLASAWYKTYKIPIIISNCTNNYGQYQHREKLIPKMITNALNCQELTIYGSGKQIRDWLHVDDHIDALICLLTKGKPGQRYCIGGECELTNRDVVEHICREVDVINQCNAPHTRLIRYVEDREGHDFRYAVNISKIRELGWSPKREFTQELKKLIKHSLRQQSDHKD